MPRISLKEAYDNRDVIAWLVKHQDAIDEMMNILKNINPDGDLTNIVLKTGDQTIDGVKTFIGKIVADCDIIQNGAAYETHAEQVYSTKDYIVLRDGALGGLSPGDFSGLRVNKYDSVNDGHLVVDRDGVARVGDVGDEQPLLTRSESGSLTNDTLLKWDGSDLKAVEAGTVGSDDKPIKLVNGVATPVSYALQEKLALSVQTLTPRNDISGITITSLDSSPEACRLIEYGKFAVLNIAVNIQGTRSGISDWYSLFPGLDLSSYYKPYMVYTGAASNLVNGHKFYFQNGQTYNETIAVQVVLIHT